MPPRRLLAAWVATATVAIARAALAFSLGLAFWAAVPAIVGWQPTTVMTASMAPAINVGDVVVAAPVERDALTAGRVLLAVDPDRPDRLRLHRLESLRPDGLLVTRGDANPAADSTPLHPDAVRGVGMLRVPWVGLPVVWLRSGDVIPLGAAALGLLLCGSVAARRGSDDDAPSPGGGPPGAAVEPAPTRRTLRHRREAARRTALARRTTVAVVVALTAGVVTAAPAWSAFSARTVASGTVVAGTVTPPQVTACRNDGGAVVFWNQTGLRVRSYDLVIDGRVAATGIPGDARGARVPRGGFAVLAVSTLTVRANVSAQWNAVSVETVRLQRLLSTIYFCG